MHVFRLTSQILGEEHTTSAEWSGRAIAVASEAGVVMARNLTDATRVAAQTLGHGLERAGKKKLPWGLHVEVGGMQAVYGDWPLLQVPVRRDPRPTPLSRIRAQWKEGDSPVDALDNAIRIIRAFAERPRRAAA